MKFGVLCLLVISLISLNISGMLLLNEFLSPKEIFIIPFDFYVAEGEHSIGFNLDRDMLHFGVLCNGCVGKRKFSVTNTASYIKQVVVYLSSSDERMRRWVTLIPASGSTIGPNQGLEVTAYAAPNGAAHTKYNGQLIIHTYRVLPFTTLSFAESK